jgi:hypothetical protein
MGKFAIRSFAVKFNDSPVHLGTPVQANVELPFNEDGFSFDANRKDGNLINNRTIPAELIPSEVESEDIIFRIGNTADGSKNILASGGQKIKLPAGNFNKLYILAAGTEDTWGDLKAGNKTFKTGFQGWTGFVGQHYGRKLYFNNLKVESIESAFTKRNNIAWFASHLHSPEANEAYEYSYLYKYEIDIPAGTKTVTLPQNSKIKIVAMTVAVSTKDDVTPLQLLYDDFKENKPVNLNFNEYVTPEMKPVAIQSPVFTEDVDERMLPRLKQYLREAGLDTVIVKTSPSQTDYADFNSGNNVTATYYPSGKSSKGIVYSGTKTGIQNILDSKAILKDTLVFNSGEGRILIDLQKPVSIDKITMFFEAPRSSQNRPRNGAPRNMGQRLFSVWTTDSNADVTGDPKSKGWKYSAIYGGAGRGIGGTGTSFIFDGKAPCRYIMLVSEGGWHGTQFLNHLDVFEKK